MLISPACNNEDTSNNAYSTKTLFDSVSKEWDSQYPKSLEYALQDNFKASRMELEKCKDIKFKPWAIYGSDPRLSGINEIIGFKELKNLKVLKLTAHVSNFELNQIDHLRKVEVLELAGNNIKDVKLLYIYNKYIYPNKRFLKNLTELFS